MVFLSQLEDNHIFLSRLHDSYHDTSPPDAALMDCLSKAFSDVFLVVGRVSGCIGLVLQSDLKESTAHVDWGCSAYYQKLFR